MLIDRTYFIGELSIPNTDQPAIGGLVDWFIAKYEPEFLQRVLGYSLYEALKVGYSEPFPAQKWIDLVQGATYTAYGKTKKWKGLIVQPASVLSAFDVLNDLDIVVGRGGMYDPAPSTPTVPVTTTVIPPAYVGKPFRIEQRGFGKLRPDEYSVTGNVLTLLGSVFTAGDTYFYTSAELAINTTTGTDKQSLIANYVYYWYVRNAHTQTTSMGEVRTKAENSDPVTPAWKISRVWREMRDWLEELVCFLDNQNEVYTDWQTQDKYCMLRSFAGVNEFWI